MLFAILFSSRVYAGALFHPERLSPEAFRKAIPAIGTDWKEVEEIYGRPDYATHIRTAGKLVSLWVYRIGSYRVMFYFENGKVAAIQQ